MLENPTAPASGIKAGLDFKGIEMDVLAFIGDGGTVDLGLASVLGAAERGDPIIYVCYDNEGFMNTGIQRSSSTPYGAWTTNTPKGKNEWRKNTPLIVSNSGAAYVATACISYPTDYVKKIKKAEKVTKNDGGMAYMHVLCPCPTEWRFQASYTIKVGRLAVQTRIWNLYAVYDKTLKVTHKVKKQDQ